MPRRRPFARENDDVDEELRQLLYKSHRNIFSVEDDCVFIVHVRHAAMRPFTAPETDDSP